MVTSVLFKKCSSLSTSKGDLPSQHSVLITKLALLDGRNLFIRFQTGALVLVYSLREERNSRGAVVSLTMT